MPKICGNFSYDFGDYLSRDMFTTDQSRRINFKIIGKVMT
jgi:hypothetical protein